MELHELLSESEKELLKDILLDREELNHDLYKIDHISDEESDRVFSLICSIRAKLDIDSN